MHYDIDPEEPTFLTPERKGVNTIRGIKFTPREVDIIACIVSGRGRKAMASLLSIGEKTVETHTQNIMRKFELHSRESIRETVEKSQVFSDVKKHYASLLKSDSFKKKLKKLSVAMGSQETIRIIYGGESLKAEDPLRGFLETSLHSIGLKVSLVVMASFLSNLERKDFEKSSIILYLPPYPSFTQAPNHREDILHDIMRLHKAFMEEKVLCLIPESLTEEAILKDKKRLLLPVDKAPDFHDLFFKIIKEIAPHSALKDLEKDFHRECDYLYGEKKRPTKESLSFISTFKGQRFSFKFLQSKKTYGWAVMVTSVFFIYSYLKTLIFVNQSAEQTKKDPPFEVRSDLTLPTSGVLMNRERLLKEIDKKFTSSHEIQAVALVGMGGSGKTTLSHHYARQQSNTFVWEVNAATAASLKESFEALAHACAATPEEQRSLAHLLEIKDTSKKEEKLMAFIKSKMRYYPQWFLIFDNVERFSEIQKYLPKDPHTWGRGRILLTTRDGTIQNNKHITDIVYVGALTAQEKLDLFSRIMARNLRGEPFSLDHQRTKAFLSQIPPFPLDITLAAYYLKATSVSYEVYLKNLQQYDENFIMVQENLLKEAGEYNKTRYSIIILSLHHILKTSHDFKDLLLLISLLDAQDIPRDLLSVCKNESIAGNFLYNLEKYSLVTVNAATPNMSPTLSLHRSLQKVILDYLSKALRLNESSPFIKAIVDILDHSIQEAIFKENLPHIKLFIRHLGVFLSHDRLLTPHDKGLMENALGHLYFYVGDYERAAVLLNKNLLMIKEYYKKGSLKAPQTLDTLGVIYREMGEYTQARDITKESLRFYQSYHPTHYKEIFHGLVHLASIYEALGYLQESTYFFQESLSLYEKFVPKDRKETIWALVHLGIAYKGLKQYQKAINVFEKSLTFYKKYFPLNRVRRAWVLASLGNVYRLEGHLDKACALLKESVALYQKESLENTMYAADALCYLGKTLQDLSNLEEAKKNFKRCLLIYRTFYEKNHLKVAEILRYLSQIALAQDHLGEASFYLKEATAIYEQQGYADKKILQKEWETLKQKNG